MTFGNRRLPPIDRPVLILTAIVAVVGVLAWRDGMIEQSDLLYFIALVPSIVLHEVSHGYVALLFGDHTAKNAGRLTLNPLRHVDVWGTFVIPIALLLTAGLAFGYAKPVPVNTSRMTKDQAMMTALCGPLVNIVLAVVAAIVLNLAHGVDWQGPIWMIELIFQFGVVNVVLATFNLIPIPPLDGSSVIERFLPYRYWPTYLKIRQYAMFGLIFVLLIAQGSLSVLFDPAIELWFKLMPWLSGT